MLKGSFEFIIFPSRGLVNTQKCRPGAIRPGDRGQGSGGPWGRWSRGEGPSPAQGRSWGGAGAGFPLPASGARPPFARPGRRCMCHWEFLRHEVRATCPHSPAERQGLADGL